MQKDKPEQVTETRHNRVRDFSYHLVVYLFVLAILFLVGNASGAFVWVALFWGFAVAMHGIYAYFG